MLQYENLYMQLVYKGKFRLNYIPDASISHPNLETQMLNLNEKWVDHGTIWKDN